MRQELFTEVVLKLDEKREAAKAPKPNGTQNGSANKNMSLKNDKRGAGDEGGKKDKCYGK